MHTIIIIINLNALLFGFHTAKTYFVLKCLFSLCLISSPIFWGEILMLLWELFSVVAFLPNKKQKENRNEHRLIHASKHFNNCILLFCTFKFPFEMQLTGFFTLLLSLSLSLCVCCLICHCYEKANFFENSIRC